MFMSLNSLDSKISPHSLHSTNSASSSRLTICTRRCLQGCFGAALCGAEGDLDVINPHAPRMKAGGQFLRLIPAILKRRQNLSSPWPLLACEFAAARRHLKTSPGQLVA